MLHRYKILCNYVFPGTNNLPVGMTWTIKITHFIKLDIVRNTTVQNNNTMYYNNFNKDGDKYAHLPGILCIVGAVIR